VNISQNVRPNQKKLLQGRTPSHFKLHRSYKSIRYLLFSKEGTLHFCKNPQIYKVLYIGEGRRDPSSALPGFLGPGRAGKGFLNPYSIEKVS
jgi:hypothetical protein